MSLSKQEVNDILLNVGLDATARSKVLKEIEELEKEKKEERLDSAAPKSKKQFVVVIRGDASLKDKIQQAWVVQRKEDADNTSLVKAIAKVGKEFNLGQKRKKRMVNAFREVFQYVKRSFWKAEDILVKTKEPCQVVFIEEEYITDVKDSAAQ